MSYILSNILYQDRIDGAEVTVLRQGRVVKSCGVIDWSYEQFYTLKCDGAEGDEVKLQLPGEGIINVMEIMVLGASKGTQLKQEIYHLSVFS